MKHSKNMFTLALLLSIAFSASASAEESSSTDTATPVKMERTDAMMHDGEKMTREERKEEF
jgi:Spy/CpxP family protein refolding chaperone